MAASLLSRITEMDFPVIVLDENDRVVSINQAAQRIASVSDDELVGRYCRLNDAGSPGIQNEAGPFARHTTLTLLGAGEEVALTGTRVSLDTSVTSRPLSVIILDTSSSLIQSMGQLREALAVAPLDMRSPLYAVLGQVDQLLSQYKSLRRSDLALILRQVLQNARRLDLQVENLLTIMDILSNRLVLAPTAIPLARLMEEVAARAEALSGERRRTLSLTLPGSEAGASIWADRQSILRAMVNLLCYVVDEAPDDGPIVFRAIPAPGVWRVVISCANETDFESSGSSLALPPADLRVALAQALVVLNDGRLMMNRTGTCSAFRVTLPNSAARKAATSSANNTTSIG